MQLLCFVVCLQGDMKTYLRSHKIAVESFNEKGLLLKFACDMAAGLQALHQQGFIHRWVTWRMHGPLWHSSLIEWWHLGMRSCWPRHFCSVTQLSGGLQIVIYQLCSKQGSWPWLTQLPHCKERNKLLKWWLRDAEVIWVAPVPAVIHWVHDCGVWTIPPTLFWQVISVSQESCQRCITESEHAPVQRGGGSCCVDYYYRRRDHELIGTLDINM